MKPKIIMLLFILCISFSFSDPIPNIPKLEKDNELPQIKGIVSPRIEFTNDKKVFVKGFKILGNKKVSLNEIEKITKEFEGKEITINDLKIISDRITEIYWNKGYITSFAYIPPQKIVDGTIEIKIIEGRAGKIKIEGNKYYTDKFIEKHFDSVKKEEILNNKTLERSLLILNEYPKLNVYANLTKGEVEGTTDIVLDVKEKSYPINFSIFGNNFGSRYTGSTRVGFSLDFANLTKNGDILSLTGIGNIENLNMMNYYKIGYGIPLMGTGGKIGLSYSKMKYEIDEEWIPLGVDGESEIYTLFLNYPFIKTRTQNLILLSSLNYKDMRNYLFERTYVNSHDKFLTLELGIQKDKLFKNSHLYWVAKTSFGLWGESEEDYLYSKNWFKFNFDLVDIFKISKTELITKFSTQFSPDNLFTGEKMIIGGPDSVRAYPTGEYLGDYGYLLSLELRTPFIPGESSINKYMNWAFFVDHGGVYKNYVLPGEKSSHYATGIGAGLRITIPNWFNLRFDAARRIGGEEPSNEKEWQYWIQAVFNF